MSIHEEFQNEFRALLAKHGPIVGTLYDREGYEMEEGLVPPFQVTDYLAIAVFEDVTGQVFTAHYEPVDPIRYRLMGLVEVLNEVV